MGQQEKGRPHNGLADVVRVWHMFGRSQPIGIGDRVAVRVVVEKLVGVMEISIDDQGAQVCVVTQCVGAEHEAREQVFGNGVR